MSPLVQVSLTLLAVAALGLGGAVVMTQVAGPVEDDPLTDVPSRLTRVEFVLQTNESESAARPIPSSGVLQLPDLDVDLDNVTRVSVTFRIYVAGPAASDSYTITVTAPDGVEQTGTHSAAATPTAAGYNQTVPIIEQWIRGQHPDSRIYGTTDQGTASRWSAENNTDDSSNGAWKMRIDMTPPPGPARTATVSLLFRFTYYEGVALPHEMD